MQYLGILNFFSTLFDIIVKYNVKKNFARRFFYFICKFKELPRELKNFVAASLFLTDSLFHYSEYPDICSPVLYRRERYHKASNNGG